MCYHNGAGIHICLFIVIHNRYFEFCEIQVRTFNFKIIVRKYNVNKFSTFPTFLPFIHKINSEIVRSFHCTKASNPQREWFTVVGPFYSASVINNKQFTVLVILDALLVLFCYFVYELKMNKA